MSDYARIERIIHYLGRHYHDQPSLGTLAKVAGLSEPHFHRLFSRWAGTTPKAFLQHITARHAKDLLQRSADVLSTSHAVGLSGPGRLHDLFLAVEGVTPGEFKSGGTGLILDYGFHETPFGRCLAAAAPRGLCHLSFSDGNDSAALDGLAHKWPGARLRRRQKTTAPLVTAAFSPGRRKKMSLYLSGSPFQLKVWQALLTIPAGAACSYQGLAARVGAPGAARAVGSAVARNSIAYLIPCHRVLRETGVIGDYRWGTARKKALLAWEQTAPTPSRR